MRAVTASPEGASDRIMSLTDLFAFTGAIALTVILKYTPGLMESRRIRRQARRAGLTDLLADLDALADNKRNGVIATLIDSSQL